MENFKKFLINQNPTDEEIFNYFEAKRIKDAGTHQELLLKQKEKFSKQLKEMKVQFLDAINALKMEIK